MGFEGRVSLLTGFGLILLILSMDLASTVIGYNLSNAKNPEEKIPPSFMIYFNVGWDILGLLASAGRGKCRPSKSRAAFLADPFMVGDRNPTGAKAPTTKAMGVASNLRRYTTRQLWWTGVGMMFLYQVGNYLYFVGLGSTSMSLAKVLYQSSTVWVLSQSVSCLRFHSIYFLEGAADFVVPCSRANHDY